MNIFDIIGPVMVGPSSSHTAGAVRIGYVTRCLLDQEPAEAVIKLHGSFGDTGIGHGTHQAIIAGLLGMKPDDSRIPNSFQIADDIGLKYEFMNHTIKGAHPNTVLINILGKTGCELEIQGSSIGGGRIMINKIDGIDVNFTGEHNTLIVHNLDKPGHVARITSMLSDRSVNIASMQLFRDSRGGYSVMVIETDEIIPLNIKDNIQCIDGILKVTYINTLN